MPDNGISNDVQKSGKSLLPDDFFLFIGSFPRKTTSHVRLHVLPASRRSECSGGRGGVDRRRLDERARGVTPERVRGQCGNHPQGPRRMHASAVPSPPPRIFPSETVISVYPNPPVNFLSAEYFRPIPSFSAADDGLRRFYTIQNCNRGRRRQTKFPAPRFGILIDAQFLFCDF